MTAKKTISDDVRRQIQLSAYLIWEREGRPEGREHKHWQMAEAEILGAKPVKKAAPAKTNGSAKPAESKAAKPKPAAKKEPVAKAPASAKSKKAAKPKSGKSA